MVRNSWKIKRNQKYITLQHKGRISPEIYKLRIGNTYFTQVYLINNKEKMSNLRCSGNKNLIPTSDEEAIKQ